MFQLPVTINQHSIGSLLANFTFHIPDLQRPYAWTDAQGIDLINDLKEMEVAIGRGEPTPSHFFGMIVTISTAGASSQLIDGQQRLTTVTVLLAAIRLEFTRVADEIDRRLPTLDDDLVDTYTAVQSQCRNKADKIKDWIFQNKGLHGEGFVFDPRLTVSPEIRTTYLAILDGNEDTLDNRNLRKPAQNLLEVLALFRKRLIDIEGLSRTDPVEQYEKLVELLQIIESGLIVAHLDSTSAESGYDLFESLNARGVPLNQLDLVKTWMLSLFAESNDPANRAAGEQVASAMHELSAGDTDVQLQFFQDFCQLRSLLTGANSDPHQRFKTSLGPIELSKNARKDVFKDPSLLAAGGATDIRQKISDEVQLMQALSPIWEDLHRSDGDRTPEVFKHTSSAQEIRASLGYLLDSQGMKFQQFGPYLTMWAYSLQGDPQLFAELASGFERFFFRFKSICGNTPSKVRDVLYTITEQADSPGGLSSSFIAETFREQVDLHAKEELFDIRLREALHYQKLELVRYFLWRIAMTAWEPPYTNQMGPVLLHHDTGPHDQKWTIEHIVPQNPNGPSTLSEDQLHRLGNLCLLNPSINSTLSNKSFIEKKTTAAAIRSRNNITVADSADIFYGSTESWGPDQVKEREDKLVALALEVFSF